MSLTPAPGYIRRADAELGPGCLRLRLPHSQSVCGAYANRVRLWLCGLAGPAMRKHVRAAKIAYHLISEAGQVSHQRDAVD